MAINIIKDLEMTTWIIQVGPKCHHMFLEREEKGNNTNNTNTYRRGWYEGRGKRKMATNQEMLTAARNRKRQATVSCLESLQERLVSPGVFFPGVSNRHAALLKPWVRLAPELASSTGRTNSITLSTQFVVVCLGSHRRLRHNSC